VQSTDRDPDIRIPVSESPLRGACYLLFLCEVCVVLGCDFAYFAVTYLPVIELRDEPLLLFPDLAMTPRSFLPRASGTSTPPTPPCSPKTAHVAPQHAGNHYM
jgi:hypothetical protein